MADYLASYFFLVFKHCQTLLRLLAGYAMALSKPADIDKIGRIKLAMLGTLDSYLEYSLDIAGYLVVFDHFV